MKPNTQQDMTLTLTTKHCIMFAALLLMAYPACAQHTATIDSLLAEARQKDQDIRSQTLQLMKRINQPPVSDSTLDSLTTLSLLQDSIDQANQQLVEQVLKNGLPEHLQPASYTTLWLIIDHSEPEMQKRYLPLMREAAGKGHIAASHIAKLTDRVRLHEGKAQQYGTQAYTFTENGRQQLYIWPVEAPEHLNRRRSEAGIASMEDYLRLLRESTGCEVIYDPKLTVEQLKKMESDAKAKDGE